MRVFERKGLGENGLSDFKREFSFVNEYLK